MCLLQYHESITPFSFTISCASRHASTCGQLLCKPLWLQVSLSCTSSWSDPNKTWTSLSGSCAYLTAAHAHTRTFYICWLRRMRGSGWTTFGSASTPAYQAPPWRVWVEPLLNSGKKPPVLRGPERSIEWLYFSYFRLYEIFCVEFFVFFICCTSILFENLH